jgi:hypothetical protein
LRPCRASSRAPSQLINAVSGGDKVSRLPAAGCAAGVLPGRHLPDGPLSQRKAIALSYKNTKVYHEGIPQWETRLLIGRREFVKEAYVDKDIPAVISTCARPKRPERAHQGRVGVPAATVKGRVKSFRRRR